MPLVSPAASSRPSGLNATAPTPWLPLAGSLPVMQEVHDEAPRREIDLVVLPTAEAVGALAKAAADTNAILHLTC